MQKRVLIVYSGNISKDAIGGIKSHMAQFTKNRVDVDFDILAVCNGELPDNIRAKNIYAIRTRLRPVIISFIVQVIFKRFTGILKLGVYDTVVFNRHEEAILSFVLPNAKKILFVHGSVLHWYKYTNYFIALLNSTLEKLLVKMSVDEIYVLLNNKKEGVPYYKSRHKIMADRIFYAPVPISEKFTDHKNIHSETAKDTVKLIYFGRISDMPKNVFMLPDIIREFIKNGVNASMSVAGDGPDLQRLRNIVDKMGLSGKFVFYGNERPAAGNSE